MRTLNLDPFWRTSVGFDRLLDMMDASLRYEPEDNFPPCNVLRTGDDTYRITLAAAGFKPDQLTITVHQNVLIISGNGNDKEKDGQYLYRGIAGRSFERRFNLADYVEVKGASFEDGLLQVELERRVPEALKPRQIQINSGSASGAVSGGKAKTIEHSNSPQR
jgi:molecular chaperone IbpA